MHEVNTQGQIKRKIYLNWKNEVIMHHAKINLKIRCLSLERPSSSAFLLSLSMLYHEQLTKAGVSMLLNSCPNRIQIQYENETSFDT